MNTNISFAAASKDYQKGQYLKSLEVLNKLIDTQQDVKTYVLLAKNLLKLGFKSEAASAYALAGERDSNKESPYTREAALLYFACGDEEQALLQALRVMTLARSDADLACVLASIHTRQGRKDLVSPYRKVISESSNPDHARLAVQLLSDDILDATNATLVHNLFKKFPDIMPLRLLKLVFAREVCDFDLVAREFLAVQRMLDKGDLSVLERDNPFYNLHWCSDEALNALASHNPSLPLKEAAARRRAVPHAWSKKIRIGYLSSDFWAGHATMKLLRRILELHDRDKFEITLFCHTEEKYLEHEAGTVDRSQWGDVCIVRGMTDEEAANAIRERQIDILVDLKGHTFGGRSRILNYGGAPLQATWLGFPGSVTDVDLDYAIGDRFVLPESSEAHYHEKLVRMPESYQPNDPANRPKPKPTTRTQVGLPEDAFVFASFNANRKINTEILDVWCNILKRAPNGVLWLMLSSPHTQTNLLNYINKKGIDSDRVIFCPRVSYEEHIDRQQMADLGIDTFPVNGHTTTSEQLWGGLPVLTVQGTNFASRVSESLLNAIGLPELVAADIKAYEDMAVVLANSPERIAEYKQRIRRNAGIMPLFDAERFTLHLERAYEIMVERAKMRLEPDHIDVPALPPRTTPFFSFD
ncbi:Predicted O-linked N-acetylglucosamine transferase, SPINDLY family [Rhizobium tibeticum]|uniref:Predicted O-linked N-acetylglucosamine transferase, SPINDLY family n=1 Tax=Rhizobium tibeticum TaxID=501024 RepID=A0A1H8CXB0_9HYPH|nr:glycosyltransferase family 41 protein [Rhizobium tibeticum]SEH50163.1 putative O-linked N-acetylglucosamine transferase, SPINDLY family [Rhizobium tibeticum]SEM98968.1 Predicted O-linked N-acetylglucosamine transferase, SPINDLY family [Rhizobium tibeticum]